MRQVLDEMANVAEVGSLLRVEERLRAILAKAGHVAVEELDPRQQPNCPAWATTVASSRWPTPEAQPEDWDAHYTLARLLDDLRAFAAQALQTHDLNAQLFAEEAEKSVHLLDVFLNDYDVVVMNPPFGYPLVTSNVIDKTYDDWCGNLLCAFFIRSLSLLNDTGFVGMVSDKTFAVKKSYAPFRQRYFLEPSFSPCVFGLGLGRAGRCECGGMCVRLRKERSYLRILVSGPSGVQCEGKRL